MAGPLRVAIISTNLHEMRDLIVAIEGRTQVRPDLYCGWRCLQVLEAAQRSAQDLRWADVPPGGCT